MKKLIKIIVLVSTLSPIFSCTEKNIDAEKPGKNEGQEPTTNCIQSQSKGPITLNLQAITTTTATFDSVLDVEQMSNYQEVGFIYSTINEMDIEASHITKIKISKNIASTTLTHLLRETQYYYTVYLQKNGVYLYGDTQSFTTPFDGNLSVEEPANCYIINHSGEYRFQTTKGNSNEVVGNVSSAAVIWESFGTETTPSIGDLIKECSYKDGFIYFETAATFKEGNALIAAKDADDNILWSWHIWLTDQPQGQVYYNTAGTMMDRNLGATSATPGDVGALGLLYQWGRKDPFMGSSSISRDMTAKSTITWPSTVSSNSSYGTITYATAHPTTFITGNSSSNYDWYYTGDKATDNTRWATSSSTKSIYDPCPAGWRVPDGDGSGVWSKALGSSSSFGHTYSSTNKGINFPGKFGTDATIWYPASGYRNSSTGILYDIGYQGNWWSASPTSYEACHLAFETTAVAPAKISSRACGFSVRCIKE